MVVRGLAGVRSFQLATPEVWERLSLARRFAVLALCLSVVSTLILGAWVSLKIEQTARAHEAGSAAIYIGHFISPLLQPLATKDGFSDEEVAALDAVTRSAALRLRVVRMKIWGTDGRLLYSSNRRSVGSLFPTDGALGRALRGTVASEFDEGYSGSEAEAEHPDMLLEIYAPIRSDSTGEVIAVAEFYESAGDLHADLIRAQMQSWLVTAILLVSIFAAFSSIVTDGSRTIEQQGRELTARIAELSEAMHKTRELRDTIERGARDVIENNERFLKTLGSELHDGPAQLIALAQLHVDSIEECLAGREVRAIRDALNGAMRDIRAISSGLLLDIEGQDLLGCIKATIRDHEKKTETKVAFVHDNLPADCPGYIKICLCRFVQEGLANAFRHAGAKDQKVLVEGVADGIRAQVSDAGPGMAAIQPSEYGSRLGLVGLRGRLESIRGTLTINSRAGEGTTLTAWLPTEAGVP